ncbi:N-formylglutamate amidohydrolase [bacterium]|nr:N-formylglutamate amidohydrolase [bacterium]
MRSRSRQLVPIITCEHGGNNVPKRYSAWFAKAGKALKSHRGYDPGGLELAQQLAGRLNAPLFFSTTTRLLVDLNRSLGHPSLHSEFVPDLSDAVREPIVRDFYLPYRGQVEHEIASRIRSGQAVCHLSIHTFTPELHGITRDADVGILYDPHRKSEKRLADMWRSAIDTEHPGLRLRRNYPYRGTSDGFTTQLRKIHPGDVYAGIELEVNQRFPLAARRAWEKLCQAIVQATCSLFRGEGSPISMRF